MLQIPERVLRDLVHIHVVDVYGLAFYLGLT